MKTQIMIVLAILLISIGCHTSKETVKTEKIVSTDKNSRAIEGVQIVEKYWKLKTLIGTEVKMSPNQTKEIYFMLKLEGNRVEGFAGCNSMLGSYKLSKGNRIEFGKMATTMMFCPEISESDFLSIFDLTDNYTIEDDVLSLNMGKRAPLAVFEAIYF
jgi:heat shock protein HslJ